MENIEIKLRVRNFILFRHLRVPSNWRIYVGVKNTYLVGSEIDLKNLYTSKA